MGLIKRNQQWIGLGLVLFTITLIGAGIRLFYVLRPDFPLNDGGMFFQMTQELQDNRFRLPLFTDYNRSEIPYAYPPLPFYIAALLQSISRLDLLTIFQYLPFTFNLLTIPAFFFLSREVLGQNYPAIFAALIFAILPPSFEWLIMGGGIVRSPAFIFSLLALWLSIRALKQHNKYTLSLATLFLSLTAFCHLEIFMITAIWIAISAFFLSRNRWGAIVLFFLGAGSAILSALWWMTVIKHHGTDPFMNALFSGQFSLARGLGELLLSNMTEEFLFTPILVFGVMGLIYQILRKEWLLPTWILAVVIFGTRSFERNTLIPLSMLSAIIIFEVILPAFRKDHRVEILPNRLFPNLPTALMVTFILFRASALSQAYLLSMGNTLGVLTENDRSAMKWVSENVPDDSRFLILVPPSSWETNETAEWFPVLANRKSINTVQGTEWLSEKRFDQHRLLYYDINDCSIESLDCIHSLAQDVDLAYTHIYLSGSWKDPSTGFENDLPIELDLLDSPEYQLIYIMDDVLIFERKNGGKPL